MNTEVEFEEVNLFDDDQSQKDDETIIAEGEQEEKDEFVVPDKFKDKSLEDVITSYTNLESEYGRKNNEVGELRKLTDEILRQNVNQGGKPVEEESNEVGFDDLIEDPNAAIDKALSQNPRLAALEAGIQSTAQENAHKAVLERHEDADAIVQSPEFQDWVGESPARQRMFVDASNNLDAGMAAEMLDLYKGTVKARQDAAEAARDAKAKEGLKDATNEKGGKKAGSSRKVYKRAELIQLKIRNPVKYAKMSDEINLAYAEGRVK